QHRSRIHDRVSDDCVGCCASRSRRVKGRPAMFERLTDEPILGPASLPACNTIFNPGACIVDGKTVLALRVEDRRGMSSIHIARSDDGVHDWELDHEPLLVGDPAEASCEWGFEDARLTYLDEIGAYVIACTAYGRGGPCVYL